MPYIQRNRQGKIAALYAGPQSPDEGGIEVTEPDPFEMMIQRLLPFERWRKRIQVRCLQP